MRKTILVFLVGLAIVVTGCGGKAATTPTAAPVQQPPTKAPDTTPATPTTSSNQPGGLPTPAGVAQPPKLDPAGMCKKTSAPQPVPNFPAKLPTDWVQGDPNAPLSIYEYSDFQ